MKLAELNPQFVRHTQRSDGVKVDIHVHNLHEADGITFLCPVCFKKNNGPRGTHGLTVTFHDRNVPDVLGSHNSQGLPSRWHVSGTDYNDLTLTPSIDISQGIPGEWHGHVTNGEVI